MIPLINHDSRVQENRARSWSNLPRYIYIYHHSPRMVNFAGLAWINSSSTTGNPSIISIPGKRTSTESTAAKCADFDFHGVASGIVHLDAEPQDCGHLNEGQWVRQRNPKHQLKMVVKIPLFVGFQHVSTILLLQDLGFHPAKILPKNLCCHQSQSKKIHHPYGLIWAVAAMKRGEFLIHRATGYSPLQLVPPCGTPSGPSKCGCAWQPKASFDLTRRTLIWLQTR